MKWPWMTHAAAEEGDECGRKEVLNMQLQPPELSNTSPEELGGTEYDLMWELLDVRSWYKEQKRGVWFKLSLEVAGFFSKVFAH